MENKDLEVPYTEVSKETVDQLIASNETIEEPYIDQVITIDETQLIETTKSKESPLIGETATENKPTSSKSEQLTSETATENKPTSSMSEQLTSETTIEEQPTSKNEEAIEIEDFEIKDLDDFELKIKEQLSDLDDEFDARFQKLKEFLLKHGGLDDSGIRILVNDFYQSIKNETTIELKIQWFLDLIKELTSYLAKKPKIQLKSEQEFNKRKNDIKNVRKAIMKYDTKVKELKKKELSLDDLEDCGTLVEIGKCQAKIMKLYKQLRALENKHEYYGEDDVDFNDLTDNQQLNRLLKEQILTKFKKENSLPDYNEVLELIKTFSKQNNDIELN